jgi:hypothetical protein
MADEGSAVVESGGAESTADVATEVLESLESESSDVSSTVDSPEPSHTHTISEPVVEAKMAETPAVVVPPLSEEEKLLQEFGFKEHRREDGREHRIARSKVLQMIASGLKRGTEKWGAEKQTIEQERAQYRADLDEMYADLRGEPKAFLAKLAQHDPRYQAFLEPPAAPVAPVAPVGEMPDPDITLQDGSRTYSIDGLKKLLEWNTANVEARLMPKLDERLKPWQEREQAAKAREEGEKVTNAVREKTRSLIAEAQNWPGFKEHEADILKALQADTEQARAAGKRPTLSLDAAYRQAVLPKLQADRNKMREELLKEINGAAAKTPTTTHGGAESVKKPGPADTRSIAARIIEQAGG